MFIALAVMKVMLTAQLPSQSPPAIAVKGTENKTDPRALVSMTIGQLGVG